MAEDRELNDQIKDLCKEKGWSSYQVWPDLVGEGVVLASNVDPEKHRRALEYRRRAIAYLEVHPEWVEAWHAAQRLNDRIEELCVEKEYEFASWEWPRPYHPLGAPDPDDDEYTRKARRLREELIAEIEAADA